MAEPFEDAEEEYEEEEEIIDDGTVGKKTCNIVFIGHVDSGKSTTSGRILYESNAIDERTMEKNTRESKQKGGEGCKFAYAMDELEEERQRGKTWECGHGSFATETKRWEIIDAPGHRHFIPHMIGGASQADVAVLIISARKGEFETGFDRDGQTREHIVLARTVGVTTLVVAVNKMDDPTVNWAQSRYNEIKDRLTPFLRQAGWKPEETKWLPISGFTGTNLLKREPEHLPWYDGPCLMEVLESIRPPERYMNAPLALSISDKYKSMGNTYILGRIEVGTMKITEKDRFLIQPLMKNVELISIVRDKRRVEEAEPGDQVTVGIRGIEDTDIHPGYVLCTRERPVHATNMFRAQFRIMECKNVLTAGYRCIIHTHAATEEAEMVKLVNILDNKKNVKTANPASAKLNDFITCDFQTQNPICAEPFTILPQFGRFIVRDEGRTIGIGVITNIQTKKTGAPHPGASGATSSSSSEDSAATASSAAPTTPAPASASTGGIRVTMPPQSSAPATAPKPAASPKPASSPKPAAVPKTIVAAPKQAEPKPPAQSQPQPHPHSQPQLLPQPQPIFPVSMGGGPQFQQGWTTDPLQMQQQWMHGMGPGMAAGYPPLGHEQSPMPLLQQPIGGSSGGGGVEGLLPAPKSAAGLRVTARPFVPKGK